MASNGTPLRRARPNILIVGTPGTGKTTLAKQIAEQAGFSHFDINEIAREHNLYESYDESYACHVLDEERVLDFIEDRMDSNEGGHVVDYHGCDFFPERWFDAVVVLRTDNTKLFDRLKARGYNERKITENVECEIFGTLAEEARDSFKEEIVQELQSDTVEQMEENVSKILSWISTWQSKK